jgi:hypothetical protein
MSLNDVVSFELAKYGKQKTMTVRIGLSASVSVKFSRRPRFNDPADLLKLRAVILGSFLSQINPSQGGAGAGRPRKVPAVRLYEALSLTIPFVPDAASAESLQFVAELFGYSTDAASVKDTITDAFGMVPTVAIQDTRNDELRPLALLFSFFCVWLSTAGNDFCFSKKELGGEFCSGCSVRPKAFLILVIIPAP